VCVGMCAVCVVCVPSRLSACLVVFWYSLGSYNNDHTTNHDKTHCTHLYNPPTQECPCKALRSELR